MKTLFDIHSFIQNHFKNSFELYHFTEYCRMVNFFDDETLLEQIKIPVNSLKYKELFDSIKNLKEIKISELHGRISSSYYIKPYLYIMNKYNQSEQKRNELFSRI